jgi:predicted nucleic acid-binding protein
MVVLANSTPLIYLAKMGELNLLDDRKARKVAAKMKVKRIGTIAIILMAHRKGLVHDLTSVLKKAQQKAFRINQRVFNRLKQQGTPGQP